MDNIQTVKQRFGIIGNDIQLTRALEKAVRVSPTDISVLVTGESGCLLYTSPSPRDRTRSRMPSSA